jgi:hypothetical protein
VVDHGANLHQLGYGAPITMVVDPLVTLNPDCTPFWRELTVSCWTAGRMWTGHLSSGRERWGRQAVQIVEVKDSATRVVAPQLCLLVYVHPID